jgi:hypothetical protein
VNQRRRRPAVRREPVEHALELVERAQVQLEQEAVLTRDAVALDHLGRRLRDLADPLQLT